MTWSGHSLQGPVKEDAAQLLAVLVLEPDATVAAPGEDDLAVRRDRDDIRSPAVAGQFPQLPAARHLPKSNGSIEASGNQRTSVPGEGQRFNLIGVRGPLERRLAAGCVPQANN